MGWAASLVGVDSSGGGLLLDAPQAFVTIDGKLWACVGSRVADHGTGAHDAATVATGSALVRINGVPVTMQAQRATCGHSLTGSGFVTLDV